MTATTEIFAGIKSLFKVSEVNRDDCIFKLFTNVSFTMCIIAAIFVAASNYVGDPIHCDPGGAQVDQATYEAHCWIHGTTRVPEKFQEHFDCRADQV